VSVTVDSRDASVTEIGIVYGPPPTRNVGLGGDRITCAEPIPELADGGAGVAVGGAAGAGGWTGGRFGRGAGSGAAGLPSGGGGAAGGRCTSTVPGPGVDPGGGATIAPPGARCTPGAVGVPTGLVGVVRPPGCAAPGTGIPGGGAAAGGAGTPTGASGWAAMS